MRIHFISIGGAIMHNMAICLHLLGHEVTGSDDEIFEPAKTRLSKYNLLPESYGWQVAKINKTIDFIILGMHAKADNPELLAAQALQIKIYSFPEYIYEHAKNKTRIVVGGSHGKTSTTAMIMHVLQHLNLKFDYLVGSQLHGFETMVSLTDAPIMIIEGDEYLTSALDLKPKFHWYKPHIAIITGIAWDHINVFPTWEFYLKQFEIFIDQIDNNGYVIANETDKPLMTLCQNAKCQVIKYQSPEYQIDNGITSILFNDKTYPLNVFGEHNLQNIQAAALALNCIDIPMEQFYTLIANFSGAAKRLELVYHQSGVRIFRDFAHSPSKLKATVNALKQQFSKEKVVAVFELHTFSSLNKDFLIEYKNTMEQADDAIVFYEPHVFELKRMQFLNESEVKEAFGEVMVITDSQVLLDTLKHLKINTPVTIAMMSSGNFAGIDLF